MKPEILVTFLPLALVAIIFQFMPLLTRRGIFFSATVDPGFPQSGDGRRLLGSYRWEAALWTVLAFALAAPLALARAALGALLPTLILVASTGFTYWLKFREVHEHYGLRRAEVRETSLSPAADEDSINLWLAVPPLLAIAATAIYLQAHWNQMPAQFPVHWGADGRPNRWASRDLAGVYRPLLTATFMNLFLLVFGWVLLRMSRKSVMRYVTIRTLEVLLYPLTFTFIVVALLPLIRIPLWLAPSVMFAFIAGIFYWGYRKITASPTAGEVPEPQSDSYWKAGMFYYNPNDPAIFVQKRVGIGYTVNFANKVSWLVLAGILLLALLPALLREVILTKA